MRIDDSLPCAVAALRSPRRVAPPITDPGLIKAVPARKSLGDLPVELLIRVVECALEDLNAWEAQHLRLCCLSLISQLFRALAEHADKDRLVIEGNSALLAFPADRASRVERVKVSCTFDVREDDEGESALWLTGQERFGQHAEAALSRLAFFRSVKHLELHIRSAQAEAGDVVGARIMAVLADLPLGQVQTLRYENAFAASLTSIWAFWRQCPSLLELSVNQRATHIDEAYEHGPPPAACRLLSKLVVGKNDPVAVESLLWHAEPESVAVHASGLARLYCHHPAKGSDRHPASRAPRAAHVQGIIFEKPEPHHGWPNLTHLSASWYHIKDEDDAHLSLGCLPALQCLTLGQEVLMTGDDSDKAVVLAKIRGALVELVSHMSRGTEVRKLKSGWTEEQVQRLEMACAKAGVALQWLDRL